MNKEHEQNDTAMPQDSTHEMAPPMALVSALADGQLDAAEADLALQALADDPQAREAWHAYHLIGDVLRSPELAAVGGPQSGEAFVQRLSLRLAREQVLGAPSLEPVAPGSGIPALTGILTVAGDGQAANDGWFRWPRVAGLASLAFAAAVGWWLVGSPAGAPQGAQGPAIATSPVANPVDANLVVTGSARGPIVRDARLDELLAAHRQGGAGALQGVTGFVQNAGFEAPAAPGR